MSAHPIRPRVIPMGGQMHASTDQGPTKLRVINQSNVMFDVPLSYEMKRQMDVTRRQRQRIISHQNRAGDLSILGLKSFTPEQTREVEEWPALPQMRAGPSITFEQFPRQFYDEDVYYAQEAPGGNEHRISLKQYASVSGHPSCELESELLARSMVLEGQYDTCFHN